jgi:predicted sulfurtransferase
MTSLRGAGFEFSRPRLSQSPTAPFKYFEVQIRQEIVALKRQDVRPDIRPGHRIDAKELCELLKTGVKPGTRLLDVRNDYEWDYGHFQGAEKIGMNNFREFQDLAKNWNRTDNFIVYCTGGVRCEKAVTLLEAEGFQQIRQLDGGVLRYFEDCGGEAWEGDLFVFDERLSIRPGDVLQSREVLSDGNTEPGSS